METEEVGVLREHHAPLGGGKFQVSMVGSRKEAGFLSSEDVDPALAEPLSDSLVDVLIQVEANAISHLPSR